MTITLYFMGKVSETYVIHPVKVTLIPIEPHVKFANEHFDYKFELDSSFSQILWLTNNHNSTIVIGSVLAKPNDCLMVSKPWTVKVASFLTPG